MGKVACGIFALILLLAVFLPKGEPANGNGEQIIGRVDVGCPTKDLADQLTAIAVSGDTEAIERFTYGHGCRVFQPGDRAFMSKASFTSACLRPRGEDACFWLPLAAFHAVRG